MRALLISYDNQNSAAESWFPMGLAYIASSIRKHSPRVILNILDLNVTHDNNSLRVYLELGEWDVIMLSFIGGYFQFRQLKAITQIINDSPRRNKMYVLAGGHMFAPNPSYFMHKFNIDCVVIGDGENIQEVLAKKPRGLYFTKQMDIDSIPWPAYDLFDISHYRQLRMPNCAKTDYCLPVLSSRGCPFRCNFCFRMDKHVRMRHVNAMVDELKFLMRTYRITYFAFGDELLMMNERRALEVSEAMRPLGVKWDCNGRLNFAKPEVLKAMKEAGCTFLNYGIEAFDDKVLENMHKRLDCDTIVKGVEATLASGISPGLNLIWGNIGDNSATLSKAVDFLLKYDDHAQLRTIRPVTPYPGSQLFDEAVKRGLIKDIEDFYENKHTNSDLFTCNFMDMPIEEAYKALFKANDTLLYNYHTKARVNYQKQLHDLYICKNADFRGWRAR